MTLIAPPPTPLLSLFDRVVRSFGVCRCGTIALAPHAPAARRAAIEEGHHPHFRRGALRDAEAVHRLGAPDASGNDGPAIVRVHRRKEAVGQPRIGADDDAAAADRAHGGGDTAAEGGGRSVAGVAAGRRDDDDQQQRRKREEEVAGASSFFVLHGAHLFPVGRG
jgi:hypothetical protein